MIRRTTNPAVPGGEQLGLPFAPPVKPTALSPLLALDPLTVRISEAVRLTGLCRSKIYELIASGDIETVKVGRCTLIPMTSLRALVGLAGAGRSR
ncbi:helix-turn-helix domain-containing protein [Novosphingobium sp.]|uniref:helix-turn-helix domain-containing protein n=1 Tax=Novosphingobium sp. TaxID=1874826 RepID=UPI00334080A0